MKRYGGNDGSAELLVALLNGDRFMTKSLLLGLVKTDTGLIGIRKVLVFLFDDDIYFDRGNTAQFSITLKKIIGERSEQYPGISAKVHQRDIYNNLFELLLNDLKNLGNQYIVKFPQLEINTLSILFNPSIIKNILDSGLFEGEMHIHRSAEVSTLISEIHLQRLSILITGDMPEDGIKAGVVIQMELLDKVRESIEILHASVDPTRDVSLSKRGRIIRGILSEAEEIVKDNREIVESLPDVLEK